MLFAEILDKLLLGKKFTRTDWKNKEVYIQLIRDQLMIWNQDGDKVWRWHTLIVSTGDIEGNDWVPVEEKVEVMT